MHAAACAEAQQDEAEREAGGESRLGDDLERAAPTIGPCARCSSGLHEVAPGLGRHEIDLRVLGDEATIRIVDRDDLTGRVAFPPGPVAIGEETIRTFAERETRMGTLRLMAPTECVMDRLAGYFHDADTQCLGQAIEAATRHPCDLERIERWARGERPHGEDRFTEFARRRAESAGS